VRTTLRSGSLLSPALLIATLLAGCATAPPLEPPPPVPPPASPAPESPIPAASAAPSGAPAAKAAVVDHVEVSPAIRAIVDATDRTDADKALDAGRKPAEMLSFFGIKSGMKVAELGAGGGYTAELLARAVGPSGKVYAQNSKFILERFAEKPWSERLARPVMKNVVRVDRDFDDPLPPEAKDLDAVFVVLFYHDTVWLDVHRDAMNQAILRSLKPGGILALIDHSGRDGTGVTEVKTLHRIEQKAVLDELLRAGFRLESEATFLRNPADTRDWNDSPTAAGDKRGTSDRFVLKLLKP